MSAMKHCTGARAPCIKTGGGGLKAVIGRTHSVRVTASRPDAPLSQSSRRHILTDTAAVALSLSISKPAIATSLGDTISDENSPYAIFQGYAAPPTSYGGYGGTVKENPKYTFEYPKVGWVPNIPTKSEKGTRGIDGRVVNTKVKGQRAFVIALGRAGESGNKGFKLGDLESTFSGFEAADLDLQDAVQEASNVETRTEEVNGYTFYLYDIDSPINRYLASISVKDGKVFALFVKSPASAFKENEEELRHILDSFKLL